MSKPEGLEGHEDEHVLFGEKGDVDNIAPTKEIPKEDIEAAKKQVQELAKQISEAKDFNELYHILGDNPLAVEDLKKIKKNLKNVVLSSKRSKKEMMYTLENVLTPDTENFLEHLRIFFDEDLNKEFKSKVMELLKDSANSMMEDEE